MVVSEPVGGAVEGDDDAAVQESVEHGCGDGGVAEDLAPGSDGPVRGDHDRGLQVALVDDLEQRGGGLAAQRQVAELVDDQEPGLADLGELPVCFGSIVFCGFGQVVFSGLGVGHADHSRAVPW